MPRCPRCKNLLSLDQVYCNRCGESESIKTCMSNIVAANRGNIDAMAAVAAMLKHGIYVDQDFQASLYWNKKAADNGSAHAQGSLGFTYYEGTGVEIDYDMAYYWFRKAALNGEPTAKFMTGYLLLGRKDAKNRGPKTDEKKALYWLVQAKHDGVEDAQKMLDLLKVEDATFLDEDLLIEIKYKN